MTLSCGLLFFSRFFESESDAGGVKNEISALHGFSEPV
jgi:hypothetical protein